MRLARDSSALLIVDLQERLLPHIHDAGIVLEHAQWLLGVARRLGVPVIASEQYPSGLGATAPALRALLEPREIVEKVHFSCVAEGCLQPHPAWERQQVVICGTEAHVCVLQTALGLLDAGKTVFVVADAVARASRPTASWRSRACASAARRSSRARWWRSSGWAAQPPTSSAT